MKPILEIQGISKKFHIYHEHQPYMNIRDSIVSLFQNKKGKKDEDFWALKDISFNVAKGESVGIIGKNGAGKSTLLKILSKITPPTSGKIISRGRITSMLEVGTGFHSELSGKENIFLNGSILGMKRREIENKFDEIVDFSGVENFLDTPLKHYSSGMQLRLAFAVAAFLEPEILIIDEVLAVGDMEFQKKCISKMDDITRSQGRTILLVSHNMAILKKLCTNAVLLNKGEIEMLGETEEVISRYSQDYSSQPQVSKYGNRDITVNSMIVRNSSGKITDSFNTFEKVEFEIECTAKKDYNNVGFALCFNNLDNVRIISLWSKLINAEFNVRKGLFKIFLSIPQLQLVPGEYLLITHLESYEEQIEGIDNYMKITVGFKPGDGYEHEPSGHRNSLYLENFKVSFMQQTNENM